jgi:hypothetical protein
MQASVTVPMAAPADEIWNIVADVRNTGKFSPEVLVGDRPVNNWHYRFTPTDGGTDVTESFRMNDSAFTKVIAVLGGQLRAVS